MRKKGGNFMKKYFLLTAAILCLKGLTTTLEAGGVHGPVIDVEVGGPYPYGYYYYYDNAYYQAWAGPGWYYGIWFDFPNDYYYWLNNNFYDVYWGGPGWYYGVYFYDEPQFSTYRRYHRYYGRPRYYGNPSYHKKKDRGRWDSKEQKQSKK